MGKSSRKKPAIIGSAALAVCTIATVIFVIGAGNSSDKKREVLEKDVDVFEINEINQDSDFYHTIMKERLLMA